MAPDRVKRLTVAEKKRLLKKALADANRVFDREINAAGAEEDRIERAASKVYEQICRDAEKASRARERAAMTAWRRSVAKAKKLYGAPRRERQSS